MYPVIDKIQTGAKLKQLMELKGYTVRDIQEYLNLACVQSIYHWLDGRSLPAIDNLYALSELFNVSIDEMICGNRKPVYNKESGERIMLYYSKIKELYAA
jgi:transcriptional regulator with XRE-family HTH domain